MCAVARRSRSTRRPSIPSNIVKALYGLVLSGGSAFGLDAAGGLTSWLAVRGRGTLLDGCCIPTVSGAILYDLANGGDKAWGETPPYRALAAQAAEEAGPEFALGNAGAGFGAIAGQIKGGLGTASARRSRPPVSRSRRWWPSTPLGSVTMPGSSTMWAWHLEQAGELGGQVPPTVATGHQLETKDGIADNTTIGVIATDCGPRPGPARALGGDGAGRLRLRDPPDSHPSRRRRRVRAHHSRRRHCRRRRTRWCGWVPSRPTSWRGPCVAACTLRTISAPTRSYRSIGAQERPVVPLPG